MESVNWHRVGKAALIVLGIWLSVRYLLPILLPFFLGFLFALLAEPGVHFLHKRLRFPRTAASFLSVSVCFAMIFGLLWILAAAAYRELTVLADGLPAFADRISGMVTQLRNWIMGLAARAPDGLAQCLGQWINHLFANGSVFFEEAATGVLGILGGILDGIPGGAMLVGTAVISSFMISAQLPALKSRLNGWVDSQWMEKYRNFLLQIKGTVLGWLKAQVKLSGVTLLIVAAGYLILGVSNPIFWAVITALVDAVPLLGTGTVLIPWSLWSLIQGQQVRAIGLLALYIIVAVTRSALEPKLVGHQLGINPLVTLLALYAGYRLWGVPGMVIAPILAVTVRQLMTARQ